MVSRNPNEHKSSTIWPRFTASGKRYMQLDANSSMVGSGPREETCDFIYLLKYV